MAELWLRKVDGVFHPDGDESLTVMAKFPIDRPLHAEITRPRNSPMHKLFFKLCARIADGIGQDTEWVMRAFKVETGHYDIFEYRGKTSIVLRSIAFHKFDQTAFDSFFNQCIQIMYDRWKIDPAAVADLLAPQEAQARR